MKHYAVAFLSRGGHDELGTRSAQAQDRFNHVGPIARLQEGFEPARRNTSRARATTGGSTIRSWYSKAPRPAAWAVWQAARRPRAQAISSVDGRNSSFITVTWLGWMA